ncbi:glutathione S-transferase [Verrucomicrobium spinosum]|uniref:glutathione S-transferase n=1 Tax=Verrucomicrobium spinosum TaxID=2736 RepID=UPI00094683AC|nr:glutathione S-transferase N-terminal domain-containing protein [Verrucomicrobium spinosum]
MSLFLYDLPHSPYCLPVKRILDAAGVAYEVIDVPNWDRTKVIELTQGAYYQVPALKHGDRVVYETGADTQDVARYLDVTFAGGTLFPAAYAGLHDILIDYLDNEVEGATFRATDVFYVPSITDFVARTMLIRHKERKFGRGCVDQWHQQIDQLRAGAATHFARFDAMVQQKPSSSATNRFTPTSCSTGSSATTPGRAGIPFPRTSPPWEHGAPHERVQVLSFV